MIYLVFNLEIYRGFIEGWVLGSKRKVFEVKFSLKLFVFVLKM